MTMNELTHDLPGMEDDEKNPTELTQIIKIFKGCSDRAFQPVAGGYPEPDKENDKPMDLDKYRIACQTADKDELLPDSLKEVFLKKIEKSALTTLAKKYPGGAKICLAFVPVQSHGVPDVEVKMLEVDARGLTYGYTMDPGYYFLVLPSEIQKECTFRVPQYENFNYPTEKERDELKKRFEQAWDNLKHLVDKKKKAA